MTRSDEDLSALPFTAVRMVKIADIVRDAGTQLRVQVDPKVYREYADEMARGVQFPPIELTNEHGRLILADGFHRTYAAELLGREEIEARVTDGDLLSAILFAASANAAHGLKRSNADKRHAVQILLARPEIAKWSDREIARAAAVDAGVVKRLRPEPSAAEQQTRTVNRGGKTFEMNVVAINRDRTEPVDPPVTKGSRQLRTFLGEIRQGADVKSAAVVAELPIGEARLHLEAEQAGEYADIVAIKPNWSVEGDELTIEVEANGTPTEDDGLAEEPPANDDAPDEHQPPSPAPAFDFASAQIRENVMAAITTLATAPDPKSVIGIWSTFLGHAVPPERVEAARIWLDRFNRLFPPAEAARLERVANMMEKL